MRLLVRLLVVLGLLLGLTSVAPLATAAPSATPSPGSSSSAPTDGSSAAGSDPASASPSPATGSAGATSSPSGGVSQHAAATTTSGAGAPVITAVNPPTSVAASRSATFDLRAAGAGVSFACSLTTPTATQPDAPCTTSSTTADPSTGKVSYTGLPVGAYTLTVTASSSGGTATQAFPFSVVDDCTTRADLCKVITGSGNPVPVGGPTFNNPLGNKTARRINVDKVIRAINGMPGYAVPNPADPALCNALPDSALPGTIRISLYSETDLPFARAMVAAAQRCVSVQILMNNHLSAADDPAMAYLQTGLGPKAIGASGKPHRNFAHRCSSGCRGRGVLHSKFYLFDSTVPTSRTTYRQVHHTVMVGSSNISGNAASVQWNDLFTVPNDAELYSQYLGMFNLMKVDSSLTDPKLVKFHSGIYTTTFWPQGDSEPDPYLATFRSVRCSGATGGTGINGHTVVYINMHAWFGTRGLALANQVRSLYARGCYVRILYSFMTKTVYTLLTHNTNSRMIARRTIFSTNGDEYANVYSHFKNIAISGVLGSNHAQYSVWTGSNNFTTEGLKNDEVSMRIDSHATFTTYRERWDYINRTKSSGTWATFLEPVGGGRAPGAVAAAPLIKSSAVTTDSSGAPKALD